MKIAILSDIHGNSYALKTVLKKIKEKNIKKILILGDMIGYYYGIDILDQLKEFDCEFIAGNHELMLKDVLDKKINIEVITKKYGKGLEYVFKKSSKTDIDFYYNLDTYKIITIDNMKLGLFHGSPKKNDEYIYPDTDYDKLKSMCKNFDYIFIGHTHYPFTFTHNKTTLINTGSVGQNRYEGGIACWVLFDTENKTIQFMNNKYNIMHLINEIEDDDNPYLKDVLMR